MLFSSVNPNDLETPEERDARMKLVRQLQKTFYQDDELAGAGAGAGADISFCSPSKDNSRILQNVPLWRVQWTELPGFQNVLNCHVPHYTHMFRRILSCPDRTKWKFGHVFLEGGSENLGNDLYKLPDSTSPTTTSQATLTGTLLQITDYIEQDDGRLTLIVQALNQRFTIIDATQHLPYAIATVQLQPDSEVLAKYNGDAIQAVQEAHTYQEWEFRPTKWKETKEGGTKTIGGVSPLVNYNAQVEMPKIHQQKNSSGNNVTQESQSSNKDGEYVGDELLFQQLLGEGGSHFPEIPSTQSNIDQMLEMEIKVWVALDSMLRLLGKANPGIRIPVPTQLLGLLPHDQKWPLQFQLENFCDQLKSKQIGSTSKSEFVRLSPEADTVRRASRFSFVVWVLFDSISFGDNTNAVTKQTILEETSITKRLEYALNQFEIVNNIIRELLPPENK
eukprot:CAMPEP_0202449834 /NCGR_PEP_ID=MMETSP1360-20130828/8530_1 /ASSEMBLY_ACC=CAM_ASM_000848 /TAXON_ID=515479 /ORGANISM="Licmophora paradoxa, Strain CCMP2313" /LENGTH=447 /DNA_ID=CAMNT_0049067893 /DNA_START=250 /DNA_END=1593 /DNA_ORIENTATION=+